MTIIAALTSLVLLAAGWLAMGFLLSAVGVVASQARSGLGLPHLIHLLLVWVISPGVGGFFAVYVTPLMYRSVSTQTIYVSVVSMAAIIIVVLFLLSIVSVRVGDSSVGSLVIFAFQGMAIFVGARVGKSLVEDVRPSTG